MAKRRWRKEWIEAVASFHDRILDRLRLDEHVAIHQYKSLYFRIFREAYESGFCCPLSYNLHLCDDGYRIEWIHARPTITGDSLWQHAVKQGWVHTDMDCTEKRYKQIDTVRTWWDEWTYAWRQLMHETRRCRVIEEPEA